MAKVMVAVDGSEYSENAFKWYLKKLHVPENTVVLFTAPEMFLYGDNSRHATEAVTEKINAETVQLRKKFETLAKAANVTTEWMQKRAMKPGEAIVEVSTELAVDYIVTGTRGQGTLARTILGSVSTYVVHHASCPVMVYRN